MATFSPIFREQQVGPADTLVRRPRPDSLQIEHETRAILTERPHDYPPRNFASPWTIQAPVPFAFRLHCFEDLSSLYSSISSAGINTVRFAAGTVIIILSSREFGSETSLLSTSFKLRP